MGSEQKKRKRHWQQYLAVAVFMLIGAVCGILMVEYIDAMFEAEKSAGEIALSTALLFIGMYAAIYLQIIFHEAGHLLFGRMTGYRFSSFRIGSLMWIKEDGRLCFRRLSVAGTGGQCLMVPPDMVDGKVPFVLYNLGGSFVNLLSAALFTGLYFSCRRIPTVSVLLLMLAVIGVAFAFVNGIPMRLGVVDNDGYNALALGKNSEALRSFWIQMKINEQIVKGVRLKDMPDQWFYVPTAESMKNSMIAVMGVVTCNRLMDAMEFDRADQQMKELLQMETGIIGLHRSLMVVDRIYCELIRENRRDVLEDMLDRQQKKFMRSMKNFPSVMRTDYAYALLAEQDMTKAGTIKGRFDKKARTYPHPSEIVGERQLMIYAEQRAEIAK